MNEWVRQQEEDWRAFRRATITGWTGIEFAVDDRPDGTYRFTDAGSPFIQLSSLELHADEQIFSFGSYQNDEVFGIHISRTRTKKRTADSPWDRVASLESYPTGRVERLELGLREKGKRQAQRDDIIEAKSTINGRQVLIIAGEVYPNGTDNPDIVWGDESLLLFADPLDATRLEWRGGRESTTLIVEG